jgi:hypothetical protein
LGTTVVVVEEPAIILLTTQIKPGNPQFQDKPTSLAMTVPLALTGLIVVVVVVQDSLVSTAVVPKEVRRAQVGTGEMEYKSTSPAIIIIGEAGVVGLLLLTTGIMTTGPVELVVLVEVVVVPVMQNLEAVVPVAARR